MRVPANFCVGRFCGRGVGFLVNVLGTIFMLQVIVLIHECGHALAARSFGVRVREIMAGLGRPVVRFRSWGTWFSFRVLPIGGGADIDDDGYSKLARWQKAVIALAGPAANLVSAWLVPAFAGVLVALANGLPAWGLPGAMFRGLAGSWDLLKQIIITTATGTAKVFMGAGGGGLAGPVGIVAEVGKMPRLAWDLWMVLFLALSVGIAVFNLLPFLPLDGGRALMSMVGGERTAALVRKAEAAGTAVLVILILVLTAGDVISLFRS